MTDDNTTDETDEPMTEEEYKRQLRESYKKDIRDRLSNEGFDGDHDAVGLLFNAIDGIEESRAPYRVGISDASVDTKLSSDGSTVVDLRVVLTYDPSLLDPDPRPFGGDERAKHGYYPEADEGLEQDDEQDTEREE